VTRFAPLIAAGGEVLDLACGSGRHARWLVSRGFRVEAADRDAVALELLAGVPHLKVREVDLENGPWPYARQHFDGIVVTNYLFRPRLPLLLTALNPGAC
jgi:SAM-dependent methyltransferase